MMAMSGSGGFILNAIKMYVSLNMLFQNLSLVSYDDPTASNALMQRRQKRGILIPEELDSAPSQSHSPDVDEPTV
jgi:hypothetical protein